MAIPDRYPFVYHPCFTSKRENLWTRIHLPVAARCNVKCIFCDHNLGTSCHTSKPGYSARVMTPDEAIERVVKELASPSKLKIVAISGPGEPLVNDETFETLQRLQDSHLEVQFCLSTNGTLVRESLDRLCDLHVSTISVSMSTQNSSIASHIYEWATIKNRVLMGIEMGKEIVSRQLDGIRAATEAGIYVKVNTILIPDLNLRDMDHLSRSISDAGAHLQNIVPLVMCDNTINLRPPSVAEITQARSTASKNIKQFIHCKQCRSDVIGIPGNDRVL
jgi:nitrogen fixation protein NifB